MKELSLIERLKQKVKSNPRRIVLPEGEDERILKATQIINKEKIADLVILGDAGKIREKASELNISLNRIEIVDPTLSNKMKTYVPLYQKKRNLSRGAIRRILSRPIYFGAMMVYGGDADGMVAGATCETATVVMAGELIIGMQKGISTPSSFFVMEVPNFTGGEDGMLIFADAALNVNPNSEQLADIAIASANSAKALLGWQPRIAMLSFSTKGSSVEAPVKKVLEATKIAKDRKPGLLIDGELQADSALIPKVAEKKIKGKSPTAGRANILIFPDLNSGNIAYKLVQRLANTNAYGPILQGFARPISDLSRGAEVRDIVGAIVITSAQALGEGE